MSTLHMIKSSLVFLFLLTDNWKSFVPVPVWQQIQSMQCRGLMGEREIIQTAAKDMLTFNGTDESDKSDKTTLIRVDGEAPEAQVRSDHMHSICRHYV